MKKFLSLSLDTTGAIKTMKAGDFNPPKGKRCVAMGLKVTAPIANSSGGAVTLSDAEKQALLDLFEFNVAFGPGLKQKPYTSQRGSRIHREARHAFNSEIEGYTDTSTGLQRSLPNAATTNVTFTLPLPLGYLWFIPENQRHLFGMGRSQCRSLQIDIKRVSDTVKAGVVLTGTVSVDFFPQYESCNGDVNGLVPHYFETDSELIEFTVGEDGLPLRLSERTAVHASSSLTSYSVSIDDEEMHSQVSPADSIRELMDDCFLSSAGILTDRETVLWQCASGANLRWLQTGKVKFRQDTKNLTSAKMGLLYIPYIDLALTNKIVSQAADLRSKAVRGASAGLFAGLGLSKRTMGLPAFALYDSNDREFESMPGPVAKPGGGTPDLRVPESFLKMAKGRFAAHDSVGEAAAAENVSRELAAVIPGGVVNGRGGTGTVFSQIRAFFG